LKDYENGKNIFYGLAETNVVGVPVILMYGAKKMTANGGSIEECGLETG